MIENPNNRSFVIETENGPIYRRNRNDLMKTDEQPLIPYGALCHSSDRSGYNPSDSGSERSNVKEMPGRISPRKTVNEQQTYVTRYGRIVKQRIVEDL